MGDSLGERRHPGARIMAVRTPRPTHETPNPNNLTSPNTTILEPDMNPTDLRDALLDRDMCLVTVTDGNLDTPTIELAAITHTHTYSGHHHHQGRLVHTTYEYATEADLICTSPWVPYRLVIEGELFTYFNDWQIIERHGWFRTPATDVDQWALPLAGPTDPRWQHKQQRGERCSRISTHTLQQTLG